MRRALPGTQAHKHRHSRASPTFLASTAPVRLRSRLEPAQRRAAPSVYRWRCCKEAIPMLECCAACGPGTTQALQALALSAHSLALRTLDELRCSVRMCHPCGVATGVWARAACRMHLLLCGSTRSSHLASCQYCIFLVDLACHACNCAYLFLCLGRPASRRNDWVGTSNSRGYGVSRVLA